MRALADGNEIRLPVAVDNLAFAPDRVRIIFSAFAQPQHDIFAQPPHDIYVVNSDGTGETWLAQSSGVLPDLAWAPDGSQIAFATDTNGDLAGEIHLVKVDGSGAPQPFMLPTCP